MSIYKLLLLRWSATLSLLLFLFVSCADRLDNDEPVADEPNVYVTLNLSMPGSGLPQTRMSSSDQDLIKSLRVLVFGSDGILPPTFRYNASVTSLESNKLTVQLIASADKIKDYYKLVLVGNAPKITNEPAYGDTWQVALDKYAFACDGVWGDSTPIPLWGETNSAVIDEKTVFTDKDGATPAVQMLRALARVDVGVDFTHSDIPSDYSANGLDYFKLKSVRVYNSKDMGHVYSNVSTPNLPTGVGNNKTNPLVYPPTGGITDAAYCGNIFVPEAGAGSFAGDPKATFLVVGGFYGVGNTTTETFYRVDFINGKTPLDLLRNHLYRVNIKKVSSKGYDNVDDAKASLPVNMTAEVIAWNNTALNEIDYDAQDFFSCATKSVVLPFEANGTVKIPVASSVPVSDWTVTTSLPGKVTVTKPASGNKGDLVFTALGTGGTSSGLGNSESATVTVKMKNLVVTFTVSQAQSEKVSPAPGGGVPGIGGGTIVDIPPTDAELEGIPLSGANSFIATKEATYVLNASFKGNDPASTLPGAGVAEILWETVNTSTSPVKQAVVKDVTYDVSTKQIVFTTTAKEGNAVIALKDKAGTILWSWHIWRTNSMPASLPLKAISSVKMMDRNLGALDARRYSALSFGLQYQWGRKDPMPGFADGSRAEMATLPVGVPIIEPFKGSEYTVDFSIKNPTKFLTYSSDWTFPNDALWGHNAKKTINDPCPPGWRIPALSVFNNASTGAAIETDYGATLSIFTDGKVSWFPALSSRGTDGFLNSEGFSHLAGRYWTSSPNSKFATALIISTGSITVSTGGYDRGGACSCRCVSE